MRGSGASGILTEEADSTNVLSKGRDEEGSGLESRRSTAVDGETRDRRKHGQDAVAHGAAS